MADKPYKPSKKELARWAEIAALPISVRYPIRRRACLERLLRYRRLLANPELISPEISFGTAHAWMKREQMMLVKLRIWRDTGHYPEDN